MITAQVQAAINDRIAAENEAEIRRLIARAEAAAEAGDYQADAENQAEIRRLEARAAAAAEARNYQVGDDNIIQQTTSTSPGKISGIHIALLAAAAFYFLG